MKQLLVGITMSLLTGGLIESDYPIMADMERCERWTNGGINITVAINSPNQMLILLSKISYKEYAQY